MITAAAHDGRTGLLGNASATLGDGRDSQPSTVCETTTGVRSRPARRGLRRRRCDPITRPDPPCGRATPTPAAANRTTGCRWEPRPCSAKTQWQNGYRAPDERGERGRAGRGARGDACRPQQPGAGRVRRARRPPGSRDDVRAASPRRCATGRPPPPKRCLLATYCEVAGPTIWSLTWQMTANPGRAEDFRQDRAEVTFS